MNLPHDPSKPASDDPLHVRLNRLPDLEAPPTLVANVMAAIQERQRQMARVWYRRPATTWPPAFRILLAVAGIVCLGAVVVGFDAISAQFAAAIDGDALASAGRRVEAIGSALRPIVGAFGLILRDAVSSPWFAAAAVASVSSYLVLFGAGTAVWRLVLRPYTR